uniref:Uncharacterized protein n=1 Tax=viral metagenome TaxID=1070528 RepID=A0A6C0JAI1_9ZZZZ
MSKSTTCSSWFCYEKSSTKYCNYHKCTGNNGHCINKRNKCNLHNNLSCNNKIIDTEYPVICPEYHDGTKPQCTKCTCNFTSCINSITIDQIYCNEHKSHDKCTEKLKTKYAKRLLLNKKGKLTRRCPGDPIKILPTKDIQKLVIMATTVKCKSDSCKYRSNSTTQLCDYHRCTGKINSLDCKTERLKCTEHVNELCGNKIFDRKIRPIYCPEYHDGTKQQCIKCTCNYTSCNNSIIIEQLYCDTHSDLFKPEYTDFLECYEERLYRNQSGNISRRGPNDPYNYSIMGLF